MELAANGGLADGFDVRSMKRSIPLVLLAPVRPMVRFRNSISLTFSLSAGETDLLKKIERCHLVDTKRLFPTRCLSLEAWMSKASEVHILHSESF